MSTPSPSDQTQALSLFTLMFGAPPGGWKDLLFQTREDAGSLVALADLLAGLPQFQSRFADDKTPTEILDTFLSFVGLVPGTQAHGVAAAAVLAQLQAGASVGTVVVQVLQFLQSTTEPLFQPAHQYLANRVEVASYHTLILGLGGTSVDALRALLAGVTADPASVVQAKLALDQLAAPPAPPDPGPPPAPALTSADSVADINSKMGAYSGTAATAHAAGMAEPQLAALASHAAKIKANGITGLALDLGAAAMTDTASAALLGKATGASVVATGASTAEVASLATLAANITAGGISGTLAVTPAQLADVRGALAPKLAGGLTITVNGTAAADSIDLSTLVNAASAIGGAGDDTYVVDDSLLHTITEAGGGGTDTLQSSVSITLPANVEVLSLTGSANIDGTGAGGDDIFYGNSGNNSLAGAAGNDTLHGGAGNDTLDGGSGSDSLAGGAGDDLYQVDLMGDTVLEIAGEGTDTVLASASYTLSAHVEVLSLTGSSDINGTGSAGNDTVYGNSGANVLAGADGYDSLAGGAGADTLQGGIGNDALDGGTGDDSLAGGQGNDLYIVDSASDTAVEVNAEGTDTVQSSVSYTLVANVEVLSLTGAGNTNGTGAGDDNILYGNSGNNSLAGAAGNDWLSGGAGNDTLAGGDGNDTLSGGAGNDTLAGGTGQDLLNGGDGNDTFVFDGMSLMDTIVGFTGGEDKLSLGGYLHPGVLDADHFINLNGDATTSALWFSNQSSFWGSLASNGMASDGGTFVFVLSDNRLYFDDNGNDTSGGYSVIAEIWNGAGTIGFSDLDFII